MFTVILASGLSLVSLSLLVIAADKKRRTAQLPPGPPRNWILGNLLDLLKTDDLLALVDSWQDAYGFMDYSEESVRGRRIANLAFKASAIRQYSPALQDNAVILMQDLLNLPKDFESVLERRNIQLALSLIFGITLDGTNQHYITTTMDCINKIAGNVLPGSRIVDFLPFLCLDTPLVKYLPSWVSFKRDAQQLNALVNEAFGRPFEDAKRRIADATFHPSFVSLILSSEEVQGDIETEDFQEMMKWISGTMFMAAAESTTSTVRVFFKAMARNPEVQAQAQEELDRVLGTRLPTMSDRKSLPYLNALLQEVIRWESIVPTADIELGFPRRAHADDVYKGMLIPKGAVILANSRSISRHEHGKGSPNDFDPTRFLEGGGARPIRDYVFGFGRSGTTSLDCKVVPRDGVHRGMIQHKVADMEAAQFA
ncbi:hypothetical protein HHX47_DHR10000309 [Lentinula edodes]|nr:hypothetical protein HHX47_DHR10000309 [Lentinula edodes]